VSILEQILATKREELVAAKSARSEAALERASREATEASPPRGFRAALVRPPGEPLRVIAEFKRASPSAGAIRAGADAAEIGRQYEETGASCISVLTDERYFDGRLEFLGQLRAAVALPLLRKDFLIEPYQVLEARAAGADAVLLIVSALDDVRLGELLAAVGDQSMDALVEVHDEAEAERAAVAGASVIGVNHRNLATFEIDMTLTGRLRGAVPEGTVLVGESGIRCPEDARALAEAGADAILVGESLMRADRPGDALAALLAGARS